MPFAFFQEFQVKTGGYSVEFGRTTGGVINAVTRSGTNEFQFGVEVTWEPRLQTEHTNATIRRQRIIASYDDYDAPTTDVCASGPIIKDKLFFFAMYELRDSADATPTTTATSFDDEKSDNDFWGAKLDWQINDNHLLELLASPTRTRRSTDSLRFRPRRWRARRLENTPFDDERRHATGRCTYTGYLTDNLLGEGPVRRERARVLGQFSLNDIRLQPLARSAQPVCDGDVGCTTNATVTAALDEREAARLDFEWTLGDTCCASALDHEINTSEPRPVLSGPGRPDYDVQRASRRADARERRRRARRQSTPMCGCAQNEVNGTFETINTAFYLEDNWSVTPSLLLNLGLRLEAFDNKNSDGDSYIKMDDMLAPRFGFSWDVKGDSRSSCSETSAATSCRSPT